MKTPEECEAIGSEMELNDFYNLQNPNECINQLKAGYLKLKYRNMLSGFIKNKSVPIEDKVKAFKKVIELMELSYDSEEQLVNIIEREMNE